MSTFTDKHDRSWQLNLSIGMVRQIKNEMQGIDLLGIGKDDFQRLLADPELLIGAMWLMVADQARRQAPAEEDIERRVAEIEAALDAEASDTQRQEARRPGLSPEEFAYGFDGDAVTAAIEAFVEAVIAFYPSHKRPALEAMWRKVQAVDERMASLGLSKIEGPGADQLIERQLEQASIEIDRMLAKQLQEKPGRPSGDSPESAGSTPES